MHRCRPLWFCSTLLGVATSCQVIAPPPTLALHASTEPAPVDATTAMVVIGVTGQLLGGDGWGMALRVERQTRDDLAVGLELTGGRGKEDKHLNGSERTGHWLVALRNYGRFASPAHDWIAATGGLSLSVMDTGLISLAPHLGGAISYPNKAFVPTLQLSAAIAVPLRRGRPFGEPRSADGENVGKRPSLTTFWLADIGFLVPVAQSGNALSLNLGAAAGYGDEEGFFVGVSAADQQRFDGPTRSNR